MPLEAYTKFHPGIRTLVFNFERSLRGSTHETLQILQVHFPSSADNGLADEDEYEVEHQVDFH